MKTRKNTSKNMVSILLTLGLCAGLTSLLRAAGSPGAAVPAAVTAATTEAKALTAALADLQKAFDLEMNAKFRYEAWAAQADAETNQSVATLFRAVALSESQQAVQHLDILKKRGARPAVAKPVPPPPGKTSIENLAAALQSARDDQALYPAFVQQAETARRDDIVTSLKHAATATESHVKLFSQALKEFAAWKKTAKSFAVCQVCGFTMLLPTPTNCPICSAPAGKFTLLKNEPKVD